MYMVPPQVTFILEREGLVLTYEGGDAFTIEFELPRFNYVTRIK